MTRPDATAPQALPVVPSGPVAVTRLLVGGNPFCGNSHVEAATNAAMAALENYLELVNGNAAPLRAVASRTG